MLTTIRKNKKFYTIPLWIVTASFVLTIFLVWGRGSVSGPGANDVATVNDVKIPVDEFYKTVDRLVNSGVPEKQAKNEALRVLLLRALLLDAAKKEGLKVSDWAVAQRIKSFPAFQKNGNFSESLYKTWLKENKLSPATFENEIRKDLLIEKLQTIVENSASVTDTEAKLYYKKVFGVRKYKYKVFTPKVSDVKITPKEIEDFYKKNKEAFSKKLMIIKGVEIPKSEKNSKELVKEAYKLAKEGKLSTSNKFTLKEIKDKKLIEEIEKENKNFGYMEGDKNFIVYIKEEKILEEPLAKVSKTIEKLLKEQKASEQALKAANEAVAKKDIKDWKETEKLSSEEIAKRFNLPPQIATAIASAKKGELLGPFKTEKGYIIMSPDSEPEVAKFDKEKIETLKTLLINEKKKAAFQSYVEFLQSKATIKVNKKFLQGE